MSVVTNVLSFTLENLNDSIGAKTVLILKNFNIKYLISALI